MSELKVSFTKEPLSEMTAYLQQGFGVSFTTFEDETTTCYHLYHNCSTIPVTSDSANIIYLNFNGRKDLLQKWAKYTECTCNLRLFCCNEVLPHKRVTIKVTDIVTSFPDSGK